MSDIRTTRYLCITAAALLLLAALWYALYIFNIVVPPLTPDETLTRAERLREFFVYQQSVTIHELGFTLTAALAFLLLAPLGMILRDVFHHERPLANIAASLFGIASSLLVAGQLTQIGTQRAILSASGDPFYSSETLDLIWDTGHMISNWLENGGYFSLALGMIGWVIIARHGTSIHRGWVALSGALAVSLFIVVICQALEIWVIYDVALSVSGALLSPAWFLYTGKMLTRPTNN